MRAKKVMAIILTLAITLALTACGGVNGGDAVSREEYDKLLDILESLRNSEGNTSEDVISREEYSRLIIELENIREKEHISRGSEKWEYTWGIIGGSSSQNDDFREWGGFAVPIDSTIETFNSLGEEGWELVAVTERFICIFKRELP